MIALTIAFLLGAVVGAFVYRHWHYDADVALYHSWRVAQDDPSWIVLPDEVQEYAIDAMRAHERLH